MSAIRAYLEEKAALPEKEWLRRDPRTTHPEILELVREFEAAGGHYDDDAERYVHDHAPDVPAHGASGRDPLCVQLGHEVYIARRILDDEENQAAADKLAAAGFVPLDDVEIIEGRRYLVAAGFTYSGQTVPKYGEPAKMRATIVRDRVAFLPARARTHAVVPFGSVLVKEA